MAVSHQTYDPTLAIQTLLTTEMNSLANNDMTALGTEFDNSTNLLYYGIFQLDLAALGVAPTADTTVDLYIVPAPDGTNYNDGSTTVAVQNNVAGSWVMRAVTAQQLLSVYPITLPPCKFKIQVLNRTGQTFAASGSTVKMLPYALKSTSA